MNDQEYSYLKSRILSLTGLDLDGYKSQQMRRRLDGFLAQKAQSDVNGYCRLLESSNLKRRELVDFLAINVSEFFRDTNLFEYLKVNVLPQLLKSEKNLNIWSAACSCGQEAYSIAILLEELPHTGRKHRILATDIDESAMDIAKAGGPYPPSEVRNVDRLLLEKYFIPVNGGYRVAEALREKVEYRRHNLLVDRYEKGFNLIVCRNAIIYFSDTVRKNLYLHFSDSLKEGGTLFIGGSEIILQPGTMGFGVMRPSFYKKLPARVETEHLLKV